MLPRSRAVILRSLRPAPLTSILLLQNPLVSTAYRDLHRPRSFWRQSPRRPPPTYSRFPLNQSHPPPHGGQLPPNSGPNGYIAQLLRLWQTNLGVRIGVFVIAIGGGIFVVLNLERVPVSGRLRFNCIAEKWEERIGARAYEQLLQQYGTQIFPSRHPSSQMVQRVMERLTPVSGAGGASWEVVVIDDPEMVNAFVIPGGKVFVFSGILPVCHDDDGLAAVLGHEIAHIVAHHLAERLSNAAIVMPLAYLLLASVGMSSFFIDIVLELAWKLPRSRKQESEADLIGLMMMSKACFNPEAAVGIWRRMDQQQGLGAPPQILSTHPSNRTRLARIEEWLPKAFEEGNMNDCGSTADYAMEFNNFYDERKKDTVWDAST